MVKNSKKSPQKEFSKQADRTREDKLPLVDGINKKGEKVKRPQPVKYRDR